MNWLGVRRRPFNAADARDGDLCLIREEMVEAVAEFVEERRHVVMRERGGAAVDALGKVADEIATGVCRTRP